MPVYVRLSLCFVKLHVYNLRFQPVGENIVRGEKESIRNLLEIFDGLLDYLVEQQSDEEPQHKGDLNLTYSFLFASTPHLSKSTEITRCS